MLDIKLLRTEPEKVKAALKSRNSDIDVDAIISLDEERRALLFNVEGLKSKQNEVSKQIPQLKKKAKT